MQELYAQGRIVQTQPGAVPRQKRYLDEMPGVPLQSIWDDIRPVQSQASERADFPTQKPETLIDRVRSSPFLPVKAERHNLHAPSPMSYPSPT